MGSIPDDADATSAGDRPTGGWSTPDTPPFTQAADELSRLLSSSGFASISDMTTALRSLADERNTARAADLMLQGYMMWMNQGMRYWGRLAEMHGSYLGTMLEHNRAMRTDPSASKAHQRALVDDTERHLREVADFTLREGRVLQQELNNLCAEVRKTIGDDEGAREPHRYARAKP